MPITFIQPIPVGNALRIFITPPLGAKKWRLLRNANGVFSGYNDLGASVIHDGIERVVLDTQALINGTTYHYGLFWFNGTVWAADGTNQASPNPTMAQLGVDVLSVVRDRLDCGLAVFVARGELHHKQGHIQVLTAPPLFEDTIWPVVTVHLQTDQSNERALGEEIREPYFNESTGFWEEFEGMLTRAQLLVVAWCLNPDERNLLRRAIKGVLIGNLPVFDAAGMIQIDISQTDTEDFQSFGAPVYQSMTTVTCEAPSIIGGVDYLVNVASVDLVVTPI